MADISLLDLLNKSTQDLKKQVRDPFPDNKRIAEEVFKAATQSLSDSVNNSKNENKVVHSPVDILRAELHERKGQQRNLPDGLELSKDLSTLPNSEYMDDPNLRDYHPSPVSSPSFSSPSPVEDFEVPDPHGIDGERDTPDDVYRDLAGVKPKKYKPVPDSSLYGLGGDRDTIQDVYADKVRRTATQEEDDDDDDLDFEIIADIQEKKEIVHTPLKVEVPEIIDGKMYATKSRSTFSDIGIVGEHVKGAIVTGKDGLKYKIVTISEGNNGVHLRSIDTGYNTRTSYAKFFGVKSVDFPYTIGDVVSYFNSESNLFEHYDIVGLNPAANNVQLIIDGKKRFIRVTKVSLVKKATDKTL